MQFVATKKINDFLAEKLGFRLDSFFPDIDTASTLNGRNAGAAK
jgi:hypothetical protein